MVVGQIRGCVGGGVSVRLHKGLSQGHGTSIKYAMDRDGVAAQRAVVLMVYGGNNHAEGREDGQP